METPQPINLIDELVDGLNKSQEDIAAYEPLPHQLEFHKAQVKNRWLIGGNRSGKTVAGAIEAIWFATGWHPYREIKTPNSGWIVSIDFPNSRDIAQPKIFDYLPKWMIASWNKSDQILKLTNGSIMGFKSCDSGWEKFQGADKDWVWFDEEPEEKVYKECLIRLKAGTKLQIWGTMTPLHGISWTYDQVYKTAREEFKIVTATIFDNVHISRDEIAEVESSLTDYEKEARLQGLYTILTGIPVFPPSKLQQYFELTCAPLYQGYIDYDKTHKVLFFEKSKIKAPLKVWRAPMRNESYGIGADVSEGDNDASTAFVVDRHKRICAEWWGKLDPDIFGLELFKLGKYYNEAFIGVERNSMGHTTVQKLRDMNYPNMYRYTQKAAKSDFDPTKLAGKTKWGWLTDKVTKPAMINELGSSIRAMNFDLQSREAVRELADYIIDEKGEMRGQGRDDRVIALAITLQMFKHIPKAIEYPTNEYQPSDEYTGY